MKRFISTLTGKHRLRLPDLGFLDSKINELQTGLTAANPLCILSGCVMTQGATTWQLSAGWVVLGWEVYQVIGGNTGIPNATANPANWYWDVTETAVAPSPVTYRDGNVHNVHFTRTAFLSTNATLFSYASTTQAYLGAWRTVGAAGQPPFLNGFTAPNGDQPLRFRINGTRQLIIEGYIANSGSPASGQNVFQLPQGINPFGPRRFIVDSAGSAAQAVIALEYYAPNWNVVLYYTGSFGNVSIYIPPISLD